MDKKFYRENRKNLFAKLPENTVSVLSSGYEINRTADENYDFQVNNNFYYLTGITQSKVYLILEKGEEEKTYLFIDAYDEMYAKWIGHKITKKEASELSGIPQTRIFYKDDYEKILGELAAKYKKIGLDLETNDNVNYNTFGLSLDKEMKEKGFETFDIYEMIVRLRMAKKPCEIEAIKKAIATTQKGIEAMMKKAEPGLYEYELEAEFDYVLKTSGQKAFAFKTIGASGINATTLHYSANNCKIADGDLVLFDLGAKEEGYSADITRTFPVNGKFTNLEKTIYSIVLSANKKIAEVAKAGMTTMDLQKICVETLTNGCLEAGLIKKPEEIKKYYFHGVSHGLGLDTHDPTIRKDPLPEGAVISDEPGLYFPEYKIGVRIEDDLYLTKKGAAVLSSSIIKEIEDIEAFMAKK